MTLAGKTFSAAGWTSASAVVRTALQMLQVAVLARYLAPADFGLMAIVNVVLSYAGLFSDIGLCTAYVQRHQINHEERSSLYWLSVIVGGALMLIVMAFSPLAANFFEEPLLVSLVVLAATNFLVIALGQQLRMHAEKSLNFRPVALIEITSALAGFVVAVLTVWLGWGVYSLVFAAMSSAWLTTLLSWLILAHGWRPACRLQWSEVKWFVRFGGGMLINNVVNHVNATIDLILGGRMLGAGQLGFFSVPRNLMMQVQGMINPVFTRVGFPLIASIQNDRERVKQIYLKTMNMTASVNAPVYVALGVFAPEIVFLLLGAKWNEALPLMRVLALWGLLRSFGSPVGSLLMGLGRVRLSAIWNIGLLLIVPPVVWYGAKWGAIGMAWAMAGLMGVLFVPAWAILVRRTCGAGFLEYTKQVVMPVLCAGLAGAGSWCVSILFESEIIRLGIGLSVGLVAYAVLSFLLNRDGILILTSALGSRFQILSKSV